MTRRFLVGEGRTRLRPLFFLLLVCVAAGFSRPEPAEAGPHTVTILHFSDYHSHAVPFYDDGRDGQGGIARAAGYLRKEKRKGAIVFSGGDMVNKGSPAWSDKYECAEWPWLNGIVDAMAFGNHDADYGRDSFQRCRAQVTYPILSANTAGLPSSAIVNAKGLRIGVFALAGSDFPTLVKVEGFAFSDRLAAARDAVRDLRERDRVDAVIMIGHEHLDDDYALARAVPGIDVILGTHSHLKRDLTRIEGTNTWFIAPGQYLTHISRVELTVDVGRVLQPARSDGLENPSHISKVTHVAGKLVRVDDSLPLDRALARRVAAMQRALERDPKYAPLFEPIARLAKPVSVEELSARAVDVMRRAAAADAALSTASSFRQALAPGVLTFEELRAAMPYDNEIVVVEMSGAQLARLLEASQGEEALVATSQQLDPSRIYRVAVTEYLANVATRYRDFFADAPKHPTGLRVRNEVRISFAP
ncbi:MAG: 5'-nucleotidase C-terminal domain-containing protein [Acidobacteriota bacterium]